MSTTLELAQHWTDYTERFGTHWEGCALHADHAGCAACLLAREVIRLDAEARRLREAMESVLTAADDIAYVTCIYNKFGDVIRGYGGVRIQLIHELDKAVDAFRALPGYEWPAPDRALSSTPAPRNTR